MTVLDKNEKQYRVRTKNMVAAKSHQRWYIKNPQLIVIGF